MSDEPKRPDPSDCSGAVVATTKTGRRAPRPLESETTKLVSIRLTHRAIDQLGALAGREGVGWQSLLKRYVDERLAIELPVVATTPTETLADVPVVVTTRPEAPVEVLPLPTEPTESPSSSEPLTSLTEYLSDAPERSTEVPDDDFFKGMEF